MLIFFSGDFISSPPHAPMWSREEIDRELHAAGAFSSEVAAFESLSVSSENSAKEIFSTSLVIFSLLLLVSWVLQ